MNMKKSLILMVFLPIVMAALFPINAIAQEKEKETETETKETCISETAREACYEYGEEYGISPEFLMTIIETESRGKPDVVGGDCRGLMQINPRWHKSRMVRLGVRDLFDERGNILVRTDYLAELFEKYEDSATVLMVYHGEKNAVNKAESGNISNYASEILERSAELELEEVMGHEAD